MVQERPGCARIFGFVRRDGSEILAKIGDVRNGHTRHMQAVVLLNPRSKFVLEGLVGRNHDLTRVTGGQRGGSTPQRQHRPSREEEPADPAPAGQA